MTDNRNITIVVLSVSALVLLAMLVGNLMQTPPAYADGAVRNGDYIMVNGSIGAGRDMLYVIHAPTKRLVAYYPSSQSNGRNIDLIDALDLEQLFKTD
ncbi:MAG: hypothetical protein ACE15C_15695 [Phycisphaerae bacterium]